MNKYTRWILTILTVGILMVNCRKKAFDEFYGRPENLAPPIYKQLESRGKFKSFLAVIDKAGYKSTLSAAGYWTIFAPNDSAFGVFLKEKGLSSVDQLDSATARQIVTYNLVYNAFDKTRLSDYQANTGWVQGSAFRRRTAYYEGFYDDTTQTGQRVKALASNRNGGFVLGDNNNKYIPYFTDNFLAKKGLSSADYTYFFPNTPYTGFNVVDANAIATDIAAENGYVHEINKVILPLPNIDRYLASKPEYSLFKMLFDKYPASSPLVSFIQNSDATTRYRNITGTTGVDVFIKMFNSGLAFSPNNENWLKQQDNDAQSDSWTMFAPTNDVLRAYLDTVILEKYKVLENLPLQIIVDLCNAHMSQTSVWPSKFATTNNFQGEPARFNANTDVLDKKVLSNGLFYGTKKVQLANVFSTVYGKAYLDPKYQLMVRALDVNYRYQITVPTTRYSMLLMPDDVLRAKGFEFNTSTNAWTYLAPGSTGTPGSGTTAIQRILGNHIILGDYNMKGGTSGIVETLGGELVKYKNDSLYSAGTPFGVKLDSFRTTVNGKAYYGNDLLWYSPKTNGKIIVDSLGLAATSPFYNFAQYLKNSTIYNSSTGDITNVTTGVYYTFLIPDNNAILAAVAAGLLPRNANGTPNFAPTSLDARDSVKNFIYYHIIDKNLIGAGLEEPTGFKGDYNTLYKTISGDTKVVTVVNPANTTGDINQANMTVTDNFQRTASVITPNSNHLGDRAVIHLINNYLKYNPQ